MSSTPQDVEEIEKKIRDILGVDSDPEMYQHLIWSLGSLLQYKNTEIWKYEKIPNMEIRKDTKYGEMLSK